MASEIAQQLMQTLQQVEETQAVDLLVALFAKEAESINLAMIEPLQEHESARRFWEKYLSVFEQICSHFTHVIASQNAVVLEWPAEGILATQALGSYRGIKILEIDSQICICSFRTHYDSAAFLSQESSHVS